MEHCAILDIGLTMISIAVIGSIGHVICLRMIKEKKLLKTPRFLIIACISLADLVFNATISIGYLIATQSLKGPLCIILSESGSLLTTIAFHMSLIMSALMAVDQLIAILYGLIYKTIVTWQRIKNVVAVALALSILVNLLTFFDTETRVIIYLKMRKSRFLVHTLIVWLCVICMVASIAKGYSISREQMRKLNPEQMRLPYWLKRKQIRNEITILASIKVIFLLPLGLYYPKLLIAHNPKFDKYGLRSLRVLMLMFCSWNAVLYLVTFRELRQSVMAIFKRETSPAENTAARVHTTHTENPFDIKRLAISAIRPDIMEMVNYGAIQNDNDEFTIIHMAENLDDYYNNQSQEIDFL